MTFYVQTYPYRRMARRWAQDREGTLSIDLREHDDAYILSALVPGISADELNIQVLEDVVHIQAERKAEENDNFLVRELPAGPLARALRLPAPIDADHVEADVTNGLLTLRLPKAHSARPKQIKIQSK
jgi:HSP20 family protein